MAIYELNSNPNILITLWGGIIALIEEEHPTKPNNYLAFIPGHEDTLYLGGKPDLPTLENRDTHPLTLLSDEGPDPTEYVLAMFNATLSPGSRIWCEETSSYLMFSKLHDVPIMLEAVKDEDKFRILNMPSHDQVGIASPTNLVEALYSISDALGWEAKHKLLMDAYTKATKRLDFAEAYRSTLGDQIHDDDDAPINVTSIQNEWWDAAFKVMDHEGLKAHIKPADIEFWRTLAKRRAYHHTSNRGMVGVGVRPRVSHMLCVGEGANRVMFEIYANTKSNGLTYSYTIFLEDNPVNGGIVGRLDAVEEYVDIFDYCQSFHYRHFGKGAEK